jgi:hypothetical protein
MSALCLRSVSQFDGLATGGLDQVCQQNIRRIQDWTERKSL